MVDIVYKSEKNRNGLVDNVNIKNGETVEKGQLLAVVLTQKMNYEIIAPSNGYVENIFIEENQVISSGTKIFDFQETVNKTIPKNQSNNLQYNDNTYYEQDSNLVGLSEVNKTSVIREQMIQKLLNSELAKDPKKKSASQINVDKINDLLTSLDASEKQNQSESLNNNGHIEPLEDLEDQSVREKYNVQNNQLIQRYNRKQNPFFHTDNIFKNNDFKNKISNLLDDNLPFTDDVQEENIDMVSQNVDAFVDKTIEYPDSTFFIEEGDITDILDGKRKIKPRKNKKKKDMSTIEGQEDNSEIQLDSERESLAPSNEIQNLRIFQSPEIYTAKEPELPNEIEELATPTKDKNEAKSLTKNKKIKDKNKIKKQTPENIELDNSEVSVQPKDESALVRIRNIESDVKEIMNNAGVSYTEEINHTLDLNEITQKMNLNLQRRQQFRKVSNVSFFDKKPLDIKVKNVKKDVAVPVTKKSIFKKVESVQTPEPNNIAEPTKSLVFDAKSANKNIDNDIIKSNSLSKHEKVKYLKNKDIVINIHNDMKQKINFLSKHSNNTPKNVFEYHVNVKKLLSKLKNKVEDSDKKGQKFYTASYFVKAVQLTLDKFPIFNSYYNIKNNQIIIKNRKNIAVSVLTKDGTKYPSVKSIKNKNIKEINDILVSKTKSLKQNNKTVEDYKIISFLISDYSRMGVKPLSFTLLDHNLASLAVAFNESALDKNSSGSKDVELLLILSYNSAIIDLIDASKFVKHLASLLNNPVLLK